LSISALACPVDITQQLSRLLKWNAELGFGWQHRVDLEKVSAGEKRRQRAMHVGNTDVCELLDLHKGEVGGMSML